MRCRVQNGFARLTALWLLMWVAAPVNYMHHVVQIQVNQEGK